MTGRPRGLGASPTGRNMPDLRDLAAQVARRGPFPPTTGGPAPGARAAVAPEPVAANEGVTVVPEPRPRGEAPELLRVPPADHDVVDLEGRLQPGDDLVHDPSPALLTHPVLGLLTEELFVRLAAAVREVRDLQRLDEPVEDERGSEAGAETEEEHAPPGVAAEGLHGGIVDHSHRPAEGAPVVEADPAPPEVVRLFHRTLVQDRPRIADADDVVAPAGDRLLHRRRHTPRGQPGARCELERRDPPRGQELDVVAAHVDHEDPHARAFPLLFHRSRAT